MAVMVTFTLKTDPATYQSMHPQMLPMARAAGLLFHSSREVGGHIAIADFWPSEEAWRNFSTGALVEGMRTEGIAPPDDLVITPRHQRRRPVRLAPRRTAFADTSPTRPRSVRDVLVVDADAIRVNCNRCGKELLVCIEDVRDERIIDCEEWKQSRVYSG
jgi:hypothetical protein